MYYTASSLSKIRDNLAIHHSSWIKGINKSESYLNFFWIKYIFFQHAQKANLNKHQLSNLILEKKTLFLKNTLYAKISLA